MQKREIMLDFLKDILGDSYTEDIDSQISKAIGKTFVPKKDFNEKLQEIKDRDTQLENIQKVDPEKLQSEITRLQTENKLAVEKYEKELKDTKFNSKLDAKLSNANVVNLKAIKALLDHEKIKYEDDDIVGLDEQLQALRETDTWAFKDGNNQVTQIQKTTGMDINKSPTYKMDDVEEAFYKRNPNIPRPKQ